MTVILEKPKPRGVQIIEQENGLYSLYTESGPWLSVDTETLLGKDLNEQQVFDMADTFKPDHSVKAVNKVVKAKPKVVAKPPMKPTKPETA